MLSAPDAAVENHRHPAVYGACDRGQRLERPGAAVELAAAVVGDLHARSSGVDGSQGVFGRLNTLDDNRQPRVCGDPLHLRRSDLLHGVGVNLLDGASLTAPVLFEVGHFERKDEAVAQVRLAVAPDGGVGREDDGPVAACECLIEQVAVEAGVLAGVELEPLGRSVARQRDLLEGHPGIGAHAHDRPGFRRAACRPRFGRDVG